MAAGYRWCVELDLEKFFDRVNHDVLMAYVERQIEDKRVRDRLRDLLRGARGRKLSDVIEQLNPVLRGWAGYFRLSQSKGSLENLDGWVRRKLRCVVWRHWKLPSTRARNLMRLGLNEARACHSAFNGRGPWWNSGASHMNRALPKKQWDALGLVSILDTINRLSRIA